MSPDAPIIILGCARSGTTYLVRALNMHPQTVISYESRIFAWAHQAIKGLTQNHDLLFDQRAEFSAHLLTAMPEVIRSFYKTRWPNMTYWGDKNPHYAASYNKGCLKTIIELFPEAKFIHIIRDGRDVVASLLRKFHDDGSPWTNFADAHLLWTTHVENACEFGRRLPPSQYYELYYEELVANDELEFEKLFKWLDLRFADRVRMFCQEQRISRTPFSGATRDLNKPPSNKDWATLLTNEEQLESLRLLRSCLRRHGYSVPVEIQSAVQTIPINLTPELARLREGVKRLGVPEFWVLSKTNNRKILRANVDVAALVELLRELGILGPAYGKDWVELNLDLPTGFYSC